MKIITLMTSKNRHDNNTAQIYPIKWSSDMKKIISWISCTKIIFLWNTPNHKHTVFDDCYYSCWWKQQLLLVRSWQYKWYQQLLNVCEYMRNRSSYNEIKKKNNNKKKTQKNSCKMAKMPNKPTNKYSRSYTKSTIHIMTFYVVFVSFFFLQKQKNK